MLNYVMVWFHFSGGGGEKCVCLYMLRRKWGYAKLLLVMLSRWWSYGFFYFALFVYLYFLIFLTEHVLPCEFKRIGLALRYIT